MHSTDKPISLLISDTHQLVYARPDEKWGETPVAWIVCRQGMTLSDEDAGKMCG